MPQVAAIAAFIDGSIRIVSRRTAGPRGSRAAPPHATGTAAPQGGAALPAYAQTPIAQTVAQGQTGPRCLGDGWCGVLGKSIRQIPASASPVGHTAPGSSSV